MTRFTQRNENPDLPGEPVWKRHLEVRVVWITPKLAAEWVAPTVNVNNRKEKPKNIDRYSRDMVSDKWPLTGQPIIFASDGTLLDGQNRLKACIAAGAPFRSLVVWGIDPEAFRHLDRGAPRSVADALGIDGEETAKTLASVLPFLWRAEKRLFPYARGGVSPTLDELYDVLDRYPEVRDSIRWRCVPRALALVPSVACYLHFQFARINFEEAEEFFGRLYVGENLNAQDPIFVLRNQLTDYRISLAGATPNEAKSAALMIRGWNAYRKGVFMKPRSSFKWTAEMPFPEAL